MKINVGHVLEQAVRMERIGISELSRKLKVSRRTIYNWFKQEDLNPHIILKVGDVIGHDFTRELPETFMKNYRHLLETETPSVANEITQDNNLVYFWMNKYVVLLEKYNEVLNLISENSKSQNNK
ncbi:transposase [Pedobacter sp. B4-66]|uniref:transposase n=1 Tax=Pedobacter sp. B4-66 TaxID=2817280 RepID=UPI001BDA3ABD|nr:transposase [Pedobacter sp. B4-66]